MNDRFLRACRREPVDRTPVWFMRQAGRYMPEYRALRERHSLLEVCRTPELAVTVTLQPVHALGVDAAILFSDLLLPLAPMGLPFDFVSGDGPRVERPIRSRADVETLRRFEPRAELAATLEAIRLLRRELRVPLIGFAGAPFTLASYAIEGGHSRSFERTKGLMYDDPATWHRLAGLLAEVVLDYLRAQAEAGAQALQVFDSWVGALDELDYRELVLPHVKRIFDGLEGLGVPLIHFGTGTGHLLGAQREAGGTVLGLDWRTPLDEGWRRIGHDRAIQGNLDPTLLQAPRECLLARVDDVLRRAEGRPGHVFNLGHGVLPGTPVENVKAVVDHVHERTADTAAPAPPASGRAWPPVSDLSTPPANAPAAEGPDREERRRLHRALLVPRLIEEKMLLLLRQGRLSKWFSGIGQEAIAVGVTAALREDDFILPLHRNLGVFTAREVDLPRLLRQLLGKEGGFTRGRDRTFHFGCLEKRIVGMISHLGAMLPVANGLALAFQLRGEARVAAVFSGEGGTSEGDFHEALNLAAVWKLPVLFVIENNQYGLSTPTHEQYACEHLADRALGYGMPGAVVDGNDVLAVHRAVTRAADRARRGDGPTLLEFMTFRMRGHEEASGTDYVPRELVEEWSRRDPLMHLERQLLEEGILAEAEPAAMRATVKAEIDALVDEALSAPNPVATAEELRADVYVPTGQPAIPPSPEAEAAAPERRYVDAISEALREAMRRDPRVVLLGQDIAEYGGVFKVTEGFADEFGKARVRNTPIIESGAIGTALGLALEGFRPMVEMQFSDFITCGFNQVVNNLAKTRFRWGAGVPVVIRAPVGGGTGAGPFHSQNVESWFTSVAGLKVVAPASPYDAKGLLLAAFEDGNPVLFLEHKLLYRSLKGKVPAGYYTLPIGRAALARRGRDATVVTYGVGVPWALEAAAELSREGREIEVVDLRSLLPWDEETVVASVRKTGRVLVLHEAPLTGGFGGEVAATLARVAFEFLDAPVERLGALDTPVPFAKSLEAVFSPKDRLLPALRSLVAY